jgi:hypothetical protein
MLNRTGASARGAGFAPRGGRFPMIVGSTVGGPSTNVSRDGVCAARAPLANEQQKTIPRSFIAILYRSSRQSVPSFR